MKRPTSHITGDLGIANVIRLVAQCGWACDKVLSDYGEDLILQPITCGAVDTFRILVQVKTIRDHVRNAAPELRFDREHILRWVRSADPVVCVFWSLSDRKGWYALPREHFTEHDVYFARAATISMKIDGSARLTKRNLHKLGWKLRLDYFNNRLLLAAQRDRYALPGPLGEEHISQIPVIVADLFRRLEVVVDGRLSPAIRRDAIRIRKQIKRREKARPDSLRLSPESFARVLAAGCLITHIGRVGGGVGTPHALGNYGADMLVALLPDDRGGA